ncbi:MAG TPA: AEC family transporter [Rectinema sp.]|nr:AEC family transporter [Spirochaetia bacterium]MDI9428264.1 AEC family transporter [Spirochaetota bacterium]NLH90420.1 AEC family transporter [Treponema sp.]OQC75005.1 MAG: Membrane transport protein [Spirochaetes bacterium ADurb.Bin001]HNP93391.1 AEC family transporter [Rectinema sp.]
MFSALQSVFSVIIMIAIGFGLSKARWFEDGGSVLVSRLVVNVALPAYMISNLMGGYDRQTLLSMLPGLVIPFAVMIVSYLMAMMVGKLLKVKEDRKGTFRSMFALSNSVFIGLPVNLLLFGDESLPYALLYYIANTTLFWTIGVYGIAMDGALRNSRPKPSLVSLSGLKRILSPPLIGFLIAVLFILTGIMLPKPIMDTCKYLGNMTTPLSMLFIGIVIARVDWKELKFEKDFIAVLVGRFLITPMFMFMVVRSLDIPLLMKEVFVMQASMPAMTQTPILAETYKSDTEYAAIGTSLTTVASMITIPFYMSIMRVLFD